MRKFEFATTQISVPANIVTLIREWLGLQSDEGRPDWWRRFDNHVLTEKGIEGEPHVTICYGLPNDSLPTVRELATDFDPFEIELGSITTFDTPEADVVVIEVKSPELSHLARRIAQDIPNENKHLVYRPHITLAYTIKGKGAVDEWERDHFSGQRFNVNSFQFADNAGNAETIKLTKRQNESEKYDGILTFESVAKADLKGRAWDVTVMGAEDESKHLVIGEREFIVSKNGRLYEVTGLEEGAPMFEGVKVYDNHQTDEEYQRTKGARSTKDEWLGSLVKPYFKRDKNGLPQIRAELRVVDDGFAGKLLRAWEQKILHTIGLSIDAFYSRGSTYLSRWATLGCAYRL